MNTLLLISLLFNIHFAASNKDEFRQGAQLDETIDWPDDFMVCVSGDTIGLGALIHPDNLVYPFNKPKVTGPCENNYWVSFMDQIFDVNETEYCLKIHRTWTIVSPCHGTQTHLQLIKVSIKDGPIIPCDAP